MTKIAVIIPAFNEARSIGQVVAALPKKVDQIIVADNASIDATAKVAREHGAVVVHEKKKGYGYACLKGMVFLEDDPPEIVVFLDGDYSDYPEDLETLVDPILKGAVVFSLGARDKKLRERGALTPQQVFGNGLACFLMRWLYQSRFYRFGTFPSHTLGDLAEFRNAGQNLRLDRRNAVENLEKKTALYLKFLSAIRKRIGVSKVSGTVKGTL